MASSRPQPEVRDSTILLPMMRQLYIATKDIGLGISKFDPNIVQLRLIGEIEHQLKTKGRVRLITLKARQMGISTVSEAFAFLCLFMYDNYRAQILANREKSAQSILAMTKLFWNTSPFRKLYSLHYNSRNDMSWVETGSSIKIATAGRSTGSDVGRGDTLHFLHASEIAFWHDPYEIMNSISQALPLTQGTTMILESTANGMGNYFEQTWKAATANEVEFTPMFFSWLDHHEYTAEWAKLDGLDQPLGALDDEERALTALGATKSQLIWRRYALKNLCGGDELKFAQEYPAIPEQAFIATGTNVFNYPLLRAAYQPEAGVPGRLYRNGQDVRFEPDPMGPMTLYRAPDELNPEWSQYVVAGDPTHRTRIGNDYACAQVFNRHTLEQVATYRARVEPGGFGQELYKLGLYYNTALVSSEVEGPSSTAIGVLLGMNYPRLYRRERPDNTPGKQKGDIWGWMTTTQSKGFMMGVVKKYLADRSLILHDSQTFEEMRDYITDEDNKMRPADEEHGHDDTVMALAQALACHYLEGPMMPFYGHQSAGNPPWGNGPPPWESWDLNEGDEAA